MKKNLVAAAQSIIITTVLAISFTFAQSSMSTSTEEGLGFFGDMSIRVYCTFSDFVPGSDNSLCSTDIFINDKSTDALTEESETSPLSETKTNQINSVISQGLTGAARVVYVPVKGDKGDAGTTTIVYETKLAGQVVSPAAYVYAGGNTNTNPFQTTVPGDIYSTFIHFLQSEVIRFQSMFGTSAEIANILASTTVTTDLYFQGATGTNLTATGTIYAENLIATNSTSTNLFSTNASLTNSTSTNFFSVLANIWDLIVNNATITNATTTNLSGTNAVLTNLTGTSATITDATTTTLFANKASITEATTTYFFAAWANFLNLYVSNLSFTNATGTNLQVANASTTNFSATGTSVITNLYGDTATFTSASSTNLFTTLFKALNATIDNLATTNATITNSTSTKIFSTNASITNASTTNLFATSANTLSLIATNATLTNATITNLRVVNCAEGNVICNGGNDTGAVVGPDPVLTIGTLNAGNIEFITGDTGFPSVTLELQS